MAKSDAPEIRVIKKKHAKHGHHGGAWKVAYADFVTAMMAFFLVMWIIGLNQDVKRAIAGYFREPNNLLDTSPKSDNVFSLNDTIPKSGDSNQQGDPASEASKQKQKKEFEEAKKYFEQALANIPDLARLKEYIQIEIVQEGLRIELIEGPEPVFFVTGSAEVKPAARKLMGVIAKEVGQLDNRVIIEGHTDRRPYKYGKQYGNWELSSDRANAARRILDSSGLWKGQVAEVRGYADKRLRLPNDPNHYSNRRVSLLIPYRKE